MRVVFMGTPDFAVNTLEKIIEAGHEVMLVVTQPDKPKGRGNTMQFPPLPLKNLLYLNNDFGLDIIRKVMK